MGLVHLIRHARPTLSGVLLGQLDPPLESNCIAPAALHVATVFASPLLRAKQTAAQMFPHHPASILFDLAEIAMGQWEGMRWDEVEAGWPALAQAKLRDWTAITPPGGESWMAFEARAKRAWNTICRAEEPVAVVAHVGINGLLHSLATGAPATQFTQEYLEVITIEAVSHRPNL